MTGRWVGPLAVMAIAAVLALAGCSSSVAPTTPPDGAAADLRFVRSMLIEHNRGLELAEIAIARTSYLDMMEFATTIAATQASEIEQLRGWLAARGRQAEDPTLEAGVGRISETQRQALDAVTGLKFANVWLAMMIQQQRGSVEVARAEVDEGNDPELVAMATAIVSAQQDQIEGLHGLEVAP